MSWYSCKALLSKYFGAIEQLRYVLFHRVRFYVRKILVVNWSSNPCGRCRSTGVYPYSWSRIPQHNSSLGFLSFLQAGDIRAWKVEEAHEKTAQCQLRSESDRYRATLITGSCQCCYSFPTLQPCGKRVSIYLYSQFHVTIIKTTFFLELCFTIRWQFGKRKERGSYIAPTCMLKTLKTLKSIFLHFSYCMNFANGILHIGGRLCCGMRGQGIYWS